jgi:hypothetical protein
MKKNQLNRLELKKNRLVRFYKYKTKKIEPNPNQKNRFKQKPIGLNRF